MKDYFNGIEFREKEVFNIAINTMRNTGIGEFSVTVTAIDCVRALHSYDVAAQMCGVFRGLMYASKYDGDWKVYGDAYKAMVYYMFHHIDEKVETA